MMKREQLLKLICDNTGKRINLPNFTIEELEDFANAVVAAESAANLQRALVAEKCLNPRQWTDKMDHAWHRNIPDVHKAFEELHKASIAPDTSTQEV